jgi:hypothetical protein
VKHPVKTLAALAILGAVAPSAHAVSIKDDVLSITPQVRIQTRLQMNDATSTTGDDFRIASNTVGAVDDPIDFSLRRARLGLSFKYGANWKGQFTLQADNVDQNATGSTAARAGLTAIRYAWLERGFALEEGMAIAVKFGLDKPEQNASDRLSSSRKLFPNDNASSSYLAPRGVGVGARFNHPVFMVAADLQNNTNGTKDVAGDNAEEEEGFFYGVRAEFSFSPDWFIARRADSFLGKEGHGLNIGLSYGANQDAVVADADPTGNTDPGQVSLSAYQIDAMLWLNGLSAYVEYRAGTTEGTANDGTAIADVDAEFITIQAGYAFPVGDEVLEPAVRYQIIDNNTDADETVNYSAGTTINPESGLSGTQIDIALNYYLSGHDNKLSLGVSLWEAEEGDADATIIRLQHQINF